MALLLRQTGVIEKHYKSDYCFQGHFPFSQPAVWAVLEAGERKLEEAFFLIHFLLIHSLTHSLTSLSL
jgi:hypothetical protein